ncbi:phospholipase D-like domain-containing protein [Actinoallomurus rhizosphaericola]|uniref:phospholipase D-like domain-containing protein n=1 Tax=Actinoallomurus rhizosphaericola TaxID=2952536 RepID=UPI0020922C50|nr:phospholipase D-like domain-containing protein [Actinoallomurus rhizosphaericola]MCO5999138.1 phospholipase D-like domain-containing protein [Actinoallomurus rhizosphaericola]
MGTGLLATGVAAQGGVASAASPAHAGAAASERAAGYHIDAQALIKTGLLDVQAAKKKKKKPSVRLGPIFNTPTGSKSKQGAIDSQITHLIAGAPKGAAIYVAMYHFYTKSLATQLINAKKRKVNVRVVLDHDSAGSAAYKTLKKSLGSNRKKSSWVTLCAKDRGCIASQFNHNKFFLFSTTLGSKNVVLQTSANATDVAREQQWNDALTLKSASVYAAYRHYFYDLAKQHHTGNYHRIVHAGKYRVDFFPWAADDPISQDLDKVSCTGGTHIRIVMGFFFWKPIAQRLWKLDDEGCRVQVVVGSVGKSALRELTRPGGRHGGPEVRYLPEGGQAYEHSKYLLLDGRYQGKNQKVVITGSVNYTNVAFHAHDEAMITIADAGLEKSYVTNFATVFGRGKALTYADAGAKLAATGVVRSDNADESAAADD